MKIILIAAVLAAQCHARLWETYNECVIRYGKETSATKESLVFEKNGIEIVAEFELTKCVSVGFRALDNHTFNDEEINKLLESNKGGSKWTPENPRPGFKSWKTNDGKSLAIYNINKKELFFVSNAWITTKRQSEKDMREKELDGF